jgi:thiol-disulfide isomerase/thioredoxin
MRGRAWAGWALIIAVALLCAWQLLWVGRHWAQVRSVTTPRGSTAPAVTIPLIDGGELRVEGTRGAPLVLAFWATWCAPCRAELPSIDRLHRRLGPAARIVAVNIDGAPVDEALRYRVRAFARELDLTLPIALDGGAAASAYHVETIPHTVVIDGDGRVRAVLEGVHDEAELARAIDDARVTPSR